MGGRRQYMKQKKEKILIPSGKQIVIDITTEKIRTPTIGTLTYVCEDNSFGCLGHEIDNECNRLVNGVIYEAIDISIGVKSTQWNLGYLDGEIGNPIGIVTGGNDTGVFGNLSDKYSGICDFIFAGTFLNVRLGKAYVICSVTGKPEFYDVEVCFIDINSFFIKITDSTLVGITGGMLHGMSGSPIIQHNKLIGALARTLYREPTIGICTFFGDMYFSQLQINFELGK